MMMVMVSRVMMMMMLMLMLMMMLIRVKPAYLPYLPMYLLRPRLHYSSVLWLQPRYYDDDDNDDDLYDVWADIMLSCHHVIIYIQYGLLRLTRCQCR